MGIEDEPQAAGRDKAKSSSDHEGCRVVHGRPVTTAPFELLPPTVSTALLGEQPQDPVDHLWWSAQHLLGCLCALQLRYAYSFGYSEHQMSHLASNAVDLMCVLGPLRDDLACVGVRRGPRWASSCEELQEIGELLTGAFNRYKTQHRGVPEWEPRVNTILARSLPGDRLRGLISDCRVECARLRGHGATLTPGLGTVTAEQLKATHKLRESEHGRELIAAILELPPAANFLPSDLVRLGREEHRPRWTKRGANRRYAKLLVATGACRFTGKSHNRSPEIELRHIHPPLRRLLASGSQ